MDQFRFVMGLDEVINMLDVCHGLINNENE